MTHNQRPQNANANAATPTAATLDEFPLEFAFSAGMTLSIFQAIDATGQGIPWKRTDCRQTWQKRGKIFYKVVAIEKIKNIEEFPNVQMK